MSDTNLLGRSYLRAYATVVIVLSLATWLLILVFFRTWLYRGDGSFKVEGYWPLINYSLDLPSFDLGAAGGASWKLAGYSSHGRSLLSLNLKSMHGTVQDPVITIAVRDRRGDEAFLYSGDPLSDHLARTEEKQDEAQRVYCYAREGQEVQGLSSEILAVGFESVTCSMIFDSPKSAYDVQIDCVERCEGLIGQLRFSSGWK